VEAGRNPLLVGGSRAIGGRYNPPGEFGALYASFEERTAIAEVARGLAQRGIDPAAYAEGRWWSYELDVTLSNVLDLTDADVLSAVGLRAEQLTGPNTSATRSVAAAARAAGFQGLIVPSAASPAEKNVVIFVEALEQPPAVLSSRPVKFPSEK
jgi:RES domain-containing protein